jgi:hypothetical protein
METDRSRRSTDTDSDTMDDPTVVDNHVAGMDPCYLTPICTDINACRLSGYCTEHQAHLAFML